MKDILGREAKVGDLFAYALIIGRSANMAVYELREIKENGSVKAHKLLESYGSGGVMVPNHHPDAYTPWHVKELSLKWVYDEIRGKGNWVERTPEDKAKQIAKAKAKTSTLGMFHERAIILPEGYVNLPSYLTQVE